MREKEKGIMRRKKWERERVNEKAKRVRERERSNGKENCERERVNEKIKKWSEKKRTRYKKKIGK